MKTDMPDGLDNQSENPEDAPESAGATSPQKALTVESLQKELQDQKLRAQADLENYRKRARRDRENDVKFAPLPLMRDLLEVVDNLERAIASSRNSGETSSLLEGVELVAHQLSDVLKNHHCEKIEPMGKSFDPNYHEAIGQAPSDDYPAGTVMRMVQTGYQLHDRVVRSAQVFISTGSDQEGAE